MDGWLDGRMDGWMDGLERERESKRASWPLKSEARQPAAGRKLHQG